MSFSFRLAVGAEPSWPSSFKFVCCAGACPGAPSTVPTDDDDADGTTAPSSSLRRPHRGAVDADGYTRLLYDTREDEFDMTDVKVTSRRAARAPPPRAGSSPRARASGSPHHRARSAALAPRRRGSPLSPPNGGVPPFASPPSARRRMPTTTTTTTTARTSRRTSTRTSPRRSVASCPSETASIARPRRPSPPSRAWWREAARGAGCDEVPVGQQPRCRTVVPTVRERCQWRGTHNIYLPCALARVLARAGRCSASFARADLACGMLLI